MKDKYNHSEGYYAVMIFLMYLITVVMVGAVSYLKGKSTVYISADIFIALVCMFAVTFYLRTLRADELNFNRKLSEYGRILNVYWLLFIIAIALTFIKSSIRPMFIAGIIIAMISNRTLGFLFNVYFAVIISVIFSEPVEIMAFYILSGTIGSLISSCFLKRKTILYAVITMLSLNTALSCIFEFIIVGSIDVKFLTSTVICSICGIILVLLTVPYIFYKIDNKLLNKLRIIGDKDYELIVMLKNYSKDLYSHSVRVANLSECAAKKLGADPLLAKVGGYYHKIGKLEGKDYVKYGIEIAESYSFPIEVVDIIREHNGKYGTPKSIEAAIVMLSDTIISAIEYLEDKQNGLAYDKDIVIEQVITTKMEHDLLDDSGMTLKMFRELKKCFMQEENIYDI